MADPVYDHDATMEHMLTALRHFLLLASVVPQAHVTRAAEVVSMAESVGAILDPTAYRRALYSGSLERQQRIVALFTRTKAELLQIFPGDAAVLSELTRRAPEAV